MLKGDLVTTPLDVVLRQLADGTSSGCLHVRDARDEEGRVYLRGGLVYAVQVPGERPLLGQHLVSSGALGPEMLAEAHEAQRTELQGWKLGELLVHLGYVDAPVVEAFLAEQVLDQLGDLLRWPTGTWKFRVNERAREDVARPETVEELLAECARRSVEWEALSHVVHGPEAVPALSAAGSGDSEMAIDPEAWSLLCKVDGIRTLAGLALECGFTLLEAGRFVHTLVESGLLEVEEPVYEIEEPVTASVASRLTAAFAPAESGSVVIPQQGEEPSVADVAKLLATAFSEDRSASDLRSRSDEHVDGSIDQISAALSAMMGPTTDEGLFAPRPRRESTSPGKIDKDKAARREREARRRTHDAAELAAAQAEVEAARRASEAGEGEYDAQIVSLADVRRDAALRDEQEARDAEEDRLRQAEDARLAEAARQADEARLAEEARDQEAALQEQARLAEEQLLAEAEEARLAEVRARHEEEQRQADEATELAAAFAEQARLADEATAAEEARLAEEAAAAEAEAARWAEEAAVLAEEARLAEEAAAAAEEARLAEEASLAEEAAAAVLEEARIAAEALLEAEQRAAESQARVQEELRQIAEDQAAAAALAEAQLAEEQAEAANMAAAAEQLAADVAFTEQAELVQQRSDAHEAFAALSASAAAPIIEPEPEPEPEPVVEDDPEPSYARTDNDTDMASLFRELSSLGMDEEPTPVTPQRSAPRPVIPQQQPKKKKGLFGR